MDELQTISSYVIRLNCHIFTKTWSTNSVALDREREQYQPRDRRLSAKLVSTFENSGSRVANTTDTYGRKLGFLDRNRYVFFQVAP
jgi:hypothetical protein